ncbi:MAG: 23S rRNA (uracil(1939)-C(5))-methyltransferase RlmD, partial [[Clostridium] leptum]
ISGVYQDSTHRIVPVDHCLIEDPKADEIICSIRRLMKSFKLLPYDEVTQKGFLRHVLIKRGFATNQIMVVLVTSTPVFPAKKRFTEALLKLHPEITTILMNLNDRYTSMVLGEQEKVLYGPGKIQDILCGCRFQISAKSFYQINPAQTEALYLKAMEYAGLTGSETIIDAYCGIGTSGLVAAKRGAKKVVGVELNRDAVKDAIENAKLNKLSNAWFCAGDAGEFMLEMSLEKEPADVVFMDPPRAGSDRTFLSSLIALSPQKVVYISCNPETQQRDLRYLTSKGPYRVTRIQPVDMFPHTNHVETVVLLSHKKPDSTISVKVEFGEGEGKVPLDNIAKRAEAYKPKERVTYKMIKEYIEAKYGFKVHTAYIAEVKRSLGLPMYDAPNAVAELKQPRKHATAEKVEAIKDALKHFGIV